jgi:hypothetical protein
MGDAVRSVPDRARRLAAVFRHDRGGENEDGFEHGRARVAPMP